ncbi:MAG: thioredoxin [Thermoproteota archaeon]|jgi:thioredoxin 1|nr:thioredoxin [Thermoproteota archaeon]
MTNKNLITLTKENWDEVLNSDKPYIVDFWAEWCVPCKILEPIYEELAREYEGRVRFGRLNVDENPDIAEKYGIMAIPTLIIFKNGKEINRLIGAAPKNKLVKFIEENIK